MSAAEIVTWNLGVSMYARKVPPTTFLLMSTRTIYGSVSREEFMARLDLGPDTWAAWVRRGYDDAVACHA
jgi:hypothetical protein